MQANENTIEVRVEDETVWLTQKLIAELFDKSRSTITEHLQNIFKESELDENSVCREFRHTGADGKEYNTKFYNLDAIISVGYRVNSLRATRFRQNKINYIMQSMEAQQPKSFLTEQIAPRIIWG